MSGGVDSSVAATLLKQAGCRIAGFTMKLWDAPETASTDKNCCTASMAKDAARVCAMLGAPHYTIDLRDEFRTEVVDKFIEEYLAGRTPNPCVHCNSYLKWGKLWEKASALGFEKIATGHYARIVRDGEGRFHLKRGLDPMKDQSYFLWQIPKRLLPKTLLPLGEYRKSNVRLVAAELNLPVAEKTESQEICFIPDNDYRSFLTKNRPEIESGVYSGDMVDESGKAIARHKGYPFFTIGQRKGLGLGGGRKYYVTGVDAAAKEVRLGDVQDLERSRFRLENVQKLTDIAFDGGRRFEVKIRYRDPGVAAYASDLRDSALEIRTIEPVRAVTPGQSGVVYFEDEVIAGGIIASY